MTVADERSTYAEAHGGALVLLEDFSLRSGLVSKPAGIDRGSIPFAFAAGALLSGLLSSTGTVVTVPSDTDAAEIRYAGNWTSSQPVGSRAQLNWAVGTHDETLMQQRSSATDEPQQVTGRDIVTLYELSGLTYKQLAAVFGVSERSLHMWANGTTRPAQRHVERLSRLIDTVRALEGTDTSSRRAAVLYTPPGGISLYTSWIRELTLGRSATGDVDDVHGLARHV